MTSAPRPLPRPGRWPRGRLAVWAVLMAAVIAIVAGTRFTADLSAFLPRAPDPAQQLLVDQVKHGPAARLLLLGIETEDDTAQRGAARDGDAGVRHRAELSRRLADRLRRTPGIAAVLNGDWPPDSPEQVLLFRHRYTVGDAVDAGRFTAAGLRAAIDESLARLAGPSGLALRELLPRDPGGETLRLVERLTPESPPREAGGVWVSADASRALLLVLLEADGTELDRQQAALAAIGAAFATVRAADAASVTGTAGAGTATADTALGPGARLLVSGAARFAVDSRDRIRGDVERLSLVGTVLILALLGIVYRSPRLIAIGVLPVASGALAATAAVSLAFGEVHGVTLGFGIALMGEAIDYAIYVLVQGLRPRMWQTLRLGVLTSLVGFGALLPASFPGLAQLGLFASVGIAVAAIVSVTVLGPRFPTAPVRIPVQAGRRLQALAAAASRLHRLPALAGAIAAALLAAHALVRDQPIWSADLAALSPIGAAAQALDTAMRADLRAPDLHQAVAVTAADDDAALAAAARLEAVLSRLVDRGLLSGFESPARLLPDAATQARRRQALPDDATLRRLVDEATRGTPLRAERLAPFIADVAQARTLPPLRPADLAGSGLGAALSAMLVPGPGRVSALLPVRGPGGGPVDPAAIRAALPAGALLIDVKRETDRLYGDYLREAMLLSVAGLALIVLLIATMQPGADGRRRRLRERLPERLAIVRRVVLPIGAALLVTAAVLVLAGVGLSLLHLVGMLLTVAVGSNYALFFLGDDDDPQLLASVLLANATTSCGFGVLGFAQAPVLAAAGQTVGLGAVLTLVFCACLRRPAEGRR